MSPTPPPRGNVTFFFSDVVSSTKIRNAIRYRYQRTLCKPHDELAYRLAQKYEGYVVQDTGDGFFIAFQSVHKAAGFAVAFQKQLRNKPLKDKDADGNVYTLQVRMGLHYSKEVQPQPIIESDRFNYKYDDTNFTARLNAIAKAGQILLSQRAFEELSDGGYTWARFPNRFIKDFDNEEQVVHEICWDKKTSKGEPGTPRVPDWYRKDMMNRFIGRDDTLRSLVEWLRSNKVILTLYGPGGAGKTRLAIESVLQVNGYFDGGTFFIELEKYGPSFRGEIEDGVSPRAVDAHSLAADIAEAWGVQKDLQEVAKDLAAYCKKTFEDKKVLLILDNWESVANVKTVEWLINFLKEAHNVRCLVTSQRAMGAPRYNQDQEVRGMEVPAISATGSVPEYLDQWDSYRLFRERAFSRNSKLFWDDATVLRILQVTEGYPLAIELAATRVLDKTLLDIADGLEADSAEWLRVLEKSAEGDIEFGDTRDDHRRHWSMEKCVHWAVKTLENMCQESFPLLSVFPYDFDVAAAQAVAKIPDPFLIEYNRILLIESVPYSIRTRYRLRQSVQQYARRRLDEVSKATIESRFVHYYSTLLEDNADINVKIKRETLDQDWRNIFHVTDINKDSLFEISNNLNAYFKRRSLWAEGEMLWQQYIAWASEHSNQLALGNGLNNVAIPYQKLNKWDKAEKALLESRRIRIEIGDAKGLAITLGNLANLYRNWPGKEALEKDFIDEAIIGFQTLADAGSEEAKRNLGSAYGNLARFYSNRNEDSKAATAYTQSLDIHRGMGNLENLVNTLLGQANFYAKRKLFIEAETNMTKALSISQDIGDIHNEATILFNLSYLNLERAKECVTGEQDFLETFGRQALDYAIKAIEAFGRTQHQSWLNDAKEHLDTVKNWLKENKIDR